MAFLAPNFQTSAQTPAFSQQQPFLVVASVPLSAGVVSGSLNLQNLKSEVKRTVLYDGSNANIYEPSSKMQFQDFVRYPNAYINFGNKVTQDDKTSLMKQSALDNVKEMKHSGSFKDKVNLGLGAIRDLNDGVKYAINP
mmetsp:Transcript_33586/g.51675  ORF Transcript_33586/g.51675 Transcript_33586/m.51675 type:complete len:139 (-) Transcript_33586:19-435(-)